MAMTYKDLKRVLSKMNKEQLNKELTIHTIGEFYPAELLVTDEDADIPGPNHPYFKIEGEQ